MQALLLGFEMVNLAQSAFVFFVFFFDQGWTSSILTRLARL